MSIKTKRISEKEAIDIINGISGGDMGLSQRTFPKLLKKDRDTKEPAKYIQNDIAKVTELTVKVGSEYVTRVLNELERENKEKSEYKAGQNTNPIAKIAENGILGISEKNGKLMIEYTQTSLPNVYPTVRYLFDNGIIEKAAIGNILPVRQIATNQGVNAGKQISIRKVYFENILDFTHSKTKYLITR